MLLVSYWWYNPLTAITGCLFLVSALLALKQPKSLIAISAYSFFLFMLLLMKPNVAIPLAGLVSLILFSSNILRNRIFLASAVSTIALYVFLLVQYISLLDVLKSYYDVAGRGATLKQFLQSLGLAEKIFSITTVILIILPLLQRKNSLSFFANRREMLLLAGLIAGVIGFLTNGEIKVVDMPLIFTASFLLCIDTPDQNICNASLSKRKDRFWLKYYSCLAIVLIFVGFGMGITRHRVWAIGFPFQHRANFCIKEGFFKGLRTGPVFPTLLQQLECVLLDNPRANIYFGPRMQWAYAAYNIQSPIREPIIWDPGVAFNNKDELKYLDSWERNRYDILVFLKNDYTYMSDDFGKYILRNYIIDNSNSLLSIWYRFNYTLF